MNEEKINILLIEDNPGDARLIEELLKETNGHDYYVRHEVSLSNSFTALDQENFDLILLDLSLPDSSGADTYSKMKDRAGIIPIILLTGYDNEEFAVSLVKSGAQDYLVKGAISRKTLVNSVSYACERSKLIKQINRELEERVKAENRANLYSQELEKTIKNRDKLFSIIAHDLRSPFQGLLGMAELMTLDIDDFSKEEIKESIYSFHTQSKNLYSLLNNLLAWTNLQRERIELNLENINVNKMFNEIILIYEKNLETKKINLNLDVPPSCSAYGDEVTFNTVIRNLFSNAIKFTPINGQIRIAVQDSTDQVIISINNSGDKIPDLVADKLFKDDSIVSTNGTAGEKGSGLGLMLCKEFVQLNGGRIWFDTKENEGTTFYFTLKAAHPNPSQREGLF